MIYLKKILEKHTSKNIKKLFSFLRKRTNDDVNFFIITNLKKINDSISVFIVSKIIHSTQQTDILDMFIRTGNEYINMKGEFTRKELLNLYNISEEEADSFLFKISEEELSEYELKNTKLAKELLDIIKHY